MVVRTLSRAWVLGCVCTLVLACGTEEDVVLDDAGMGGEDGALPPEVVPPPVLLPDDVLLVSGTVIDFQTGEAIEGAATVATLGVTPPPTVTTTGPAFSVELPPFSSFHLLAASLPTHRATYGASLTVEDADLPGVSAEAVSEAHLAELATGFGITPNPGTAIVIGQLLDSYGEPRAGISGDAFEIAYGPSARGPYFLADDLSPSRELESQARGYFVFFDVPVDGVEIGAAPTSPYTITGSGPTAAGAITLLEVVVDGEPPPVVEDVSFARDVAPIFSERGCFVCHSGGGIGRDQGGLTLSGSTNLMHRELTEEVSDNHRTLRIDRAYPEESLVLRMPSFETPPDAHPNVTFVDAYDPDYQIILAWIREGAYDN